MLGMFAASSIAAIVRGGMEAAASQKNVNAAAAKLRETTQRYVDSAKQSLERCEDAVAEVVEKINDLTDEIVQAAAQLNVAKRDFKQQYYHMSVIVVIIIVLVFFLLLLKKLKLLTLDPLAGK